MAESDRSKQAQARFYDAEAAPQEFQRLLTQSGAGNDALDNALYYLLNHFDAALIRRRLKLAAEVHPNEVAKRLFPGEGEDEEPEPEEVSPKQERPEKPGRPLSKKEQALRDLGF